MMQSGKQQSSVIIAMVFGTKNCYTFPPLAIQKFSTSQNVKAKVDEAYFETFLPTFLESFTDLKEVFHSLFLLCKAQT